MTLAAIILGLIFLSMLDSRSTRSKNNSKITPTAATTERFQRNKMVYRTAHTPSAGIAYKSTPTASSAQTHPFPRTFPVLDTEETELLKTFDDEIRKPSRNKSLKPKSLAIAEAVRRRSIDKVVHFTQFHNLSSILRIGLVSRDAIDAEYTDAAVNVLMRLDYHTDTTSLSIQHPNSPLLYKLQKSNPDNTWAIIEYSPAILWNYECAFYKHNAAKRCMSLLDIDDLMNVHAFESMFPTDTSGGNRALASYTEDVQAEVLARNRIPPNEIVAVHFNDQDALKRFKMLHPDTPAYLSHRYFSYRN